MHATFMSITTLPRNNCTISWPAVHQIVITVLTEDEVVDSMLSFL
jgi:hypothetical protein